MISILLPIYNGIEYIDESITSILEQSFTQWELLIGINGHPPNSDIFKRAKSFESDKIKVFDFDKNLVKGKSESLNELIKYCSYDYIALIDVDDIWIPNKLEKQVEILNRNWYDVIGTNGIYFGDKTEKIDIPSGDLEIFHFKSFNPILNCSAIIKKNLCFWKNNFFGIEDYELWLRLKKEAKRFYNCEEILIKHRIYNDSFFNAKGNSNEDNLKKLLDLY